ncbi:MAG: signal peptide peptidase SppA [Bacteroidia bacterium]|nr:signal peptide peptidase SppA [Bacteroidia bacterium]
MKQFLKYTFATIVGSLISFLLLVFIFIFTVSAMVSAFDKEEIKELKNNSILTLKLDYVIPERTSKNPFESMDLSFTPTKLNSGLNDILKAIKEAKTNENIKGIYLNVSISPNSYATLESIREALIDFKTSKKFIIAYGEVLEEHSYYIASVADEIYLNPSGELLLDGFSNSTPYLKGLFDKLGIEPQLIRHGKYKAAGEPLITNKMSDENRKQIEAYTGSIFNNFCDDIAKSRNLKTDELIEIINELKVQSPEDAKKLGLITNILFEDEVLEILTKKTGVEKYKDVTSVSSEELAKHAKNTPYSVKEKIAVVYCVGDIVSGNSDKNTMGSTTIVESIRKAKEDSTIKAVVLRVNSPGGSAMASDVIWREVKLTKKIKPVIVSMGDMAASGGYYIACPANTIVAQKNTITGSIGVFALLINAQKLIKEKLGINVETVKFGKYADMGTTNRALTDEEKQIMQRYIDRIYTDFIEKVAEGRNLKKEFVDSIAQGRVWSGTDAKAIGLIDEYGGLDKAIEIAAKQASIDKYRIINYPEQKSALDELMNNLSMEASAYWLRYQMGEQYTWYKQVKDATKYEGLQMRVPVQSSIQ